MEPCPANVYIDYMLSWVQEELDDENIFPSQIGMEFFRIPILCRKQEGTRVVRINGFSPKFKWKLNFWKIFRKTIPTQFQTHCPNNNETSLPHLCTCLPSTF